MLEIGEVFLLHVHLSVYLSVCLTLSIGLFRAVLVCLHVYLWLYLRAAAFKQPITYGTTKQFFCMPYLVSHIYHPLFSVSQRTQTDPERLKTDSHRCLTWELTENRLNLVRNLFK